MACWDAERTARTDRRACEVAPFGRIDITQSNNAEIEK
ncbi:hypothetical protein R2A130_2593 [Ahrensia sp. R2A130]|nr:hypothetical protein R2A130_2593 [Ahrensia sp. R2A130]